MGRSDFGPSSVLIAGTSWSRMGQRDVANAIRCDCDSGMRLLHERVWVSRNSSIKESFNCAILAKKEAQRGAAGLPGKKKATMYLNQQTRNTVPRRHRATAANSRMEFDTRACDFAWEFGWSCHEWHGSGTVTGEHAASGMLSHLDRALALAG